MGKAILLPDFFYWLFITWKQVARFLFKRI